MTLCTSTSRNWRVAPVRHKKISQCSHGIVYTAVLRVDRLRLDAAWHAWRPEWKHPFIQEKWWTQNSMIYPECCYWAPCSAFHHRCIICQQQIVLVVANVVGLHPSRRKACKQEDPWKPDWRLFLDRDRNRLEFFFTLSVFPLLIKLSYQTAPSSGWIFKDLAKNSKNPTSFPDKNLADQIVRRIDYSTGLSTFTRL